MSRTIQYDRIVVEVAAGVTDHPIAITYPVLEFRVPSSTVNASVKFGDKGAKPVNLTPGGRNRFCFDSPPSQIFVTAPGGDAIEVFGSSEVEPSFAPFGSESGAAFEVFGTWPEHQFALDGGAVPTAYGMWTHSAAGTFFTAKTGGAVDEMKMVDGRICWQARSTAAEAKRQWGYSFPIQIPLTDRLRTGQTHSEFQRVYWDTFWMKATGISDLEYRTGVMYGIRQPGVWFNDSNLEGWGVAMRDDGGGVPELWYAANRVNDGTTPDEEVNLNVLMNVWRRIDVLHVAPTLTRRARLLIYVDGALLIEREWAVGAGALPDYSASAGYISRMVQCGASAGGMTLNFGGVTNRRGSMLFSGALV